MRMWKCGYEREVRDYAIVAGNGKCLFFIRMVGMYGEKWNWGKSNLHIIKL